MSSIHSIEGTLSAKPFGAEVSGRLHGDHKAPKTGSLHGGHESRQSGTLHGARESRGTIAGKSAESPTSSAIAELSGLISNLGSLSAQAQSLPLSAPILPGLPQSQGYRPQPTDYTQLSNDAN
ncbi:MAG: hypothetical protein WA431_09380 [Candidatus Cybelea sp.]